MDQDIGFRYARPCAEMFKSLWIGSAAESQRHWGSSAPKVHTNKAQGKEQGDAALGLHHLIRAP